LDQINAPCVSCAGLLELLYVFSFTVRDRTGEIDVMLFGQDATHFLQGVPAADLTQDQTAREAVTDLVRRVRGAWMDCCLKSYQHVHTGETMFRIFDTELAPEF